MASFAQWGGGGTYMSTAEHLPLLEVNDAGLYSVGEGGVGRRMTVDRLGEGGDLASGGAGGALPCS